ncbi:MAG: redox-regulated ATPase YchF [Candidatus Babeliales bacterium]|nr:redox-regulated ATPase YchF [Candidatus Babeliales bacterium]
MSIKAGLVGLPNVGKSTLFNALTKSSVPAENYPFCTIDPHVAITEVPDDRMVKLQKLFKSEKLIPATVTFVDIAGLVKGAASGEGLGNQFLSNIRETDLILHVLRCFEDSNITHTSAALDPVEDYETIVAELMLKDIESINNRLEKIAKSLKALQNDPKKLKEANIEAELLNKVKHSIERGDATTARKLILECEVETIPLLSTKNYLIIANISESDIETYQDNPFYQKLVAKFTQERVIPICVKLESELSQLSDEAEIKEMMEMMGLKTKGLDTIITKTYANLGLITFFTCGPKEIHAWPIKQGTTIRKAAGEIHSDLERGFICAEIFNCNDLFEHQTQSKLKDLGKIKTAGQDYLVADGDIVNIKFNV